MKKQMREVRNPPPIVIPPEREHLSKLATESIRRRFPKNTSSRRKPR